MAGAAGGGDPGLFATTDPVHLLDRVLLLLKDENTASLALLMRATSLAASHECRQRCRLRRLKEQARAPAGETCPPHKRWKVPKAFGATRPAVP